MKEKGRMFFFKKKNQKTFAPGGSAGFKDNASKESKFFLLLFCSQKRSSF